MALTKVLITVKTYPTLSDKYNELVCTAGFRENGAWIRIYPVPFRKKPYNEQYKKYDWIELDLVKNKKDFRPESYRPVSQESEIRIAGHVDTASNWAERKKLVLGKVFYTLAELIAEAKDKKVCTSLAVFKPTKIVGFESKPVSKHWSKKQLAKLQQLNLFDKVEVVRKLPYKFSYVVTDNQGQKSKMMIEDWEIGQLYWNCLARHEGNEDQAVADVRAKYLDNFAKMVDLFLFLGTTKQHHYVSKNPFIIIGTFYPKIEAQGSLFG